MKDINKKVQDLLINNKYYVKINREKKHKFSSNYWSVISDPDGNVRNRLDVSEKKNHLNDTKYLTQYINKYHHNKNFLDIGCGLGYFLSSLKSNKKYIYGTEMDDYAVKHASKYGNVFKGELKKINFQKNFFDVILMHHVIEHIHKPELFIAEVNKIIKKKGTLIIATPDFDSGAARLFKNKYRLLHDKTHVSLFSNDSLYRFLRDNGFKIFKVEYPYFETRFFSKKNILKMLDTNAKISPPFYGNFMTFFCKKI